MKLKFLSALCVGLFALGAWAQRTTVTVSGTVTDESGKPIPYAAIQIKGTTQGIVTDLNGNYNMTVPVGSIIEASSLGYITKEERMDGRTAISFILKEDSTLLEEVLTLLLMYF